MRLKLLMDFAGICSITEFFWIGVYRFFFFFLFYQFYKISNLHQRIDLMKVLTMDLQKKQSEILTSTTSDERK